MALRRISTRRRKNKVNSNDEVGFSTLPDQVHRKSLKRGFEFTLMVIGESGLGKSTFINSLFLTDLYNTRVVPKPSDVQAKTIEIQAETINLEEKGVRLRLTVVDTPGFGDAINAKDCWKPIANYIEEQHHKYYISESGCGVERRRIQDTRVHCCLYFIPPYVHGLRRIDIDTMHSLHDRVNIVPVIAKADALTKTELKNMKAQILEDIHRFDIKIYEFPDSDSDDDETFKQLDAKMRAAFPFAVISSNTTIEFGDKRIRARTYPWGIIDIESDEYCDFSKLRTFLCSSHMQDLKDVTNDLFYENFRTNFIRTGTAPQNINTPDTARSNWNQARPVHYEEEDKDFLIKQKESEIKNMQAMVNTMKKALPLPPPIPQKPTVSLPLFMSTNTQQHVKKTSIKTAKPFGSVLTNTLVSIKENAYSNVVEDGDTGDNGSDPEANATYKVHYNYQSVDYSGTTSV